VRCACVMVKNIDIHVSHIRRRDVIQKWIRFADIIWEKIPSCVCFFVLSCKEMGDVR